jgi:hypothetical protein
MKKRNIFLFSIIGVLAIYLIVEGLIGCSSSKSISGKDQTTNGDQAEVQVIGKLAMITPAAPQKTGIESPAAAADTISYNDDPSLCPDGAGGGVSANITPSAYTVALKRMTLLGDSSTATADYELFSTGSIDSAYKVDFVTDTTFFASDTLPPVGTYVGVEIEVFYIEMELPLIVPALSDTQAVYITRGYFDTVGNVVPRDVTIFSDTTECWIDRQIDGADPYGLIPVTNSHPFQVLDLWADDNFWGRYPITISSADISLGTDFTFNMSTGGEALVIPDSLSGAYVILFEFDVTNRFTFWEYLETLDSADADGVFTVGYDCGYRILFPDVQISFTEEE